jgi:anthranilate synthase component 1
MDLAAFTELVAVQRARGVHRMIVPVVRRRSADLLTPVSAFLALRKRGSYAFLLESVEGGEHLARYSFLGIDPYGVLTAREATVTYEARSPARRLDPPPGGNVFEALKSLLGQYEEIEVPGLPHFTCGAVGFMGYDTVRLVEHLPAAGPDTLGLPDGVWCFYDTVVAFDHVKHQLAILSAAYVEPETDLAEAFDAACRNIDRLAVTLRAGTFDPPTPVRLRSDVLRSSTPRPAFEAAVERAKRYIFEGDIFQVVLSQRFTLEFEGDPFNLYRALRQINPSPYLFFLDFETFALVGSSPEVLVRVEDGRAEVLPIAGTRPRGHSSAEDERLEHELLADPKERAEHLMLVDLGRNDLGRVCTFQSVEVERYAYVERYSHVMHIVSSVAGRVREDTTPLEVLAACFPAGTVSGAPKVRAMEIIDELEPHKRGVYAGAVGHIDFSGNMDTCIAIRTMVVQGRNVYIQAGAGIVADSDPAREFEETENKARALHEALRAAAGDLL